MAKSKGPKCPRCKVKVHRVKDKSQQRWKWSKTKPSTYVCLSCESELVALHYKAPGIKPHTIYTESQIRSIPPREPIHIPAKQDRRRKPKLCPQCKEVTFLIGVCVYPDRQNPIVCSKPCKRKYKKEHQEESAA